MPTPEYGQVSPVGNPGWETYTNNMAFGETRKDNAREFMAMDGFLSFRGLNAVGNLTDKVARFSAILMYDDSGDGWTLNPLQVVEASCGDINAQGIENDQNIHNQDYGNTIGGAGLGPTAAYEYSSNGYSTKNKTASWLLTAAGPGRINRGIVVDNVLVHDFIENYSNCLALIQNYGDPDYLIYSESDTSKMRLDGDVGFGQAPVAGVAVNIYRPTASIELVGGGTSAVRRYVDYGATANFRIFDFDFDGGVLNMIFRNDSGTVRTIPLGFDTINKLIRPAVDNEYSLGYYTLRFNTIFGRCLNLILPASNTPSANGEVTFEATDTNLIIRRRNSAGVLKSVTLPWV